MSLNPKQEIVQVLSDQRIFFSTHQTKAIGFRKHALRKLKKGLVKYENEILEALNKDLGKKSFESYSNELGIVLEEINLHLRKLSRWSKRKWVGTNQLIHFFSRSFIQAEPYGQVLIIAPWNYPFQLLMAPLVGAISAGNTVVLKPSEFTSHTANLIQKIISEIFPPEYVNVFQGGVETSQILLEQKWDYIFFTGSPKVGKIVMKAAAEHLTPVTLELGGKSPAIVSNNAKLKLSAKRLMWGKLLNAGQTCIAPDYALVHESVKDDFISFCIDAIHDFFGENPQKSDFSRISTHANVERLQSLMKNLNIVFGGKVDLEDKYVSPTIVTDVSESDDIMRQEIFGPILPILIYNHLDEVISFINSRPKPLALYFFGSKRQEKERIVGETSSGGVLINDSLMQFVHPRLPFGGVGNSGMGKYHGKKSFETFSHFKPLIRKSTRFDVPIRYAPYASWKMKLIKFIMK